MLAVRLEVRDIGNRFTLGGHGSIDTICIDDRRLGRFGRLRTAHSRFQDSKIHIQHEISYTYITDDIHGWR